LRGVSWWFGLDLDLELHLDRWAINVGCFSPEDEEATSVACLPFLGHLQLWLMKSLEKSKDPLAQEN